MSTQKRSKGKKPQTPINAASHKEIDSKPAGSSVKLDIDHLLASGSSFKDLIFERVDFSGRLLIGARFENCSLRHCNFQDSDLSYVRFTGCDLYCADFANSSLYACWFNNCDLTKASFAQAYMSGMRMSDVDVTHASFGEAIRVGKNRKSLSLVENESKPVFPFGSKIPSINQIESDSQGIGVSGFFLWIEFSEDPKSESWRMWRRRSEVCKILKRIHLENGYLEKATRYYYLERVYRRFSMPKGIERFTDWFFGDCLWGYGVVSKKAVISLFISVLIFAGIYLLLPIMHSGSGIKMPSGKIAHISLAMTSLEWIINVTYAIYFSALTAMISSFGDVTPLGWCKLVASIQLACSVVLISLLLASIAKRIANI